jgi:hypothetical protein
VENSPRRPSSAAASFLTYLTSANPRELVICAAPETGALGGATVGAARDGWPEAGYDIETF